MWWDCDDYQRLGYQHPDGKCQRTSTGQVGHVTYSDRDDNPTFTPDEAVLYDRAMTMAFAICDRANEDIYAISMDSFDDFQKANGYDRKAKEG